MKKLLTILPIIALASVAYAQDNIWEFIPGDSLNTFEGNYTPTGETLIDVSDGPLTVTGQLENKGTTTIIGSNSIDANGNVTKNNDSTFKITGSKFANRTTLILKNVNINSSQQLYNVNPEGGSVLMEIHGYVTFSNQITPGSNSTILIKEGARLNANKYIAQDNSSSILKFENATAKQYVSNTDLKDSTLSSFSFGLSNDSLKCIDASTAVVEATYIKDLAGKIELDLTDFILGEDFVIGETYNIALFNKTYAALSDTWKILEENVINGDFAQFAGFTKSEDGKVLFAQVTAIPEPSTYAAIFGALALAFVACRRRK